MRSSTEHRKKNWDQERTNKHKTQSGRRGNRNKTQNPLVQGFSINTNDLKLSSETIKYFLQNEEE